MSRLFLFVLLLLPLGSSAQIYKSTDEQGNVTFSDAPPPGTSGQPVELRETNTVAAPPERRQESKPTPQTVMTTAYELAIVAPANETTFPMGPGNFSVSVSLQPALAGNNRLQLYLDGTPWGDPQQGTSWSLTNVFRGAHDLTVAVTDNKGKQLASSEPVRVYVLRPSINFRNRN